MRSIYQYIQKYLLVWLSVGFVAIHLISLTLLPTFTDETNYLDWGWREIHMPGYLFYSLYDAKQPLMMWFFGLAETVIKDPLFAGRSVSVVTGLITALGVYAIAKKVFNTKTAILSFTIYSLTHYFFFFDRQALVESGMSAIIIWIGVVLFTKTNLTLKKCFRLGLLFGLGYLTKSNVLLVILSSLVILIAIHRVEITSNFGASIAKIILIFATAAGINLPMIMHPWFSKYIHLSTQYTFTLSQLLEFPIAQWWKNVATTSSILFWFLTPVLFVAIILGILKSKKYTIALWAIAPLVLQIILAKFLVSRYLVSYVPVLVIFASYFALSQKRWLRNILLLGIFLPSIYLNFLLLTQPPQYFYQLSRVTNHSYIGGYVTAEASGYNLLVARKYFEDLATKGKYILGIAVFSGNPEAGLLVYFRNHPNISVTYLDSMLFADKLTEYACLKFNKPVYLATRDKNGAGLLKYFDRLTEIRNTYNDSVIYVFALKENCQGNTLDLTAP